MEQCVVDVHRRVHDGLPRLQIGQGVTVNGYRLPNTRKVEYRQEANEPDVVVVTMLATEVNFVDVAE